MCGIVAAVSHPEVTPFLINGLKTLEYRGYDIQLLAHHVALVKGTDVDKPRNLAKSVTVE